MSDDNEETAFWREYKHQRATKRSLNRDASTKMLKAAGIPFESRNGGEHLIVAGRYDFWPGTGLWVARGDATKRRGVNKLIERVKEQR